MSDIVNENKVLRNRLVAYIFWFFLGFFGAHRFWWCKYKSATFMLLLLIFGWVLAIGGGITSMSLLAVDNNSLSNVLLGSGIACVLGILMLCVNSLWWCVDMILILFWPPKN